jgi:prepilin-type N-terminal cleavage/methylation domain-containing protein
VNRSPSIRVRGSGVRTISLIDGGRNHPAACRRDAGVTLIELLIAMLLLGVILSAAASSLIQFGRTGADNERRVQATALITRLHEELQALPWQDAVLYEDDVQALFDDGFDGLTEGVAPDGGPEWKFDGLDLVTIDGPGVAARRDDVPLLVTPMEIDNRDYDVIRFVTWGNRAAGIKRFTTVVNWRVYDKDYEERFISERAATAAEAGDPELPRVVQFDVGPPTVQLVDNGLLEPAQNERDLQITVRFSEGVDSARLYYRSVDVALDGAIVTSEKNLNLTSYITDPVTGKYIAFRGTIPALSRTFPNGTRAFEVRGALGSDTFNGRTSIEFEGGSIEPEDVGEPAATPPPEPDPTDPPPSEPIAINNVTISSPTTVCNDANDRFMKQVKVTALVNGMTPEDYDVSIAYSANGSPRSEEMLPTSETFALTNAEFTKTFALGIDHEFRPVGQNKPQAKDETDFIVTATRQSGGSPATKSTNPAKLTVTLDHGANTC